LYDRASYCILMAILFALFMFHEEAKA
jgi:hypothetical protein